LARAAAARRTRTGRLTERWFVSGGGRRLVAAVEKAILPGIQLHYAVRKRYIEGAVEEAIRLGGRQVVVLGAGMDALALRFARRSGEVRCIEVDHPATQAIKAGALAGVGAVPTNLILVPADLSRQPLSEALRAGGYDAAVPVCFVAEGLTMYLDLPTVRGLLLTVGEQAPSGSRFIWTLMEPDDAGRIAFRDSRSAIVDRWLRSRGEAFTWGLAADEVAGFVASLGLDLLELVGSEDLRARYLTGQRAELPLAAGEMICVVRRP
ncbi:MAG TPA: SAM-dependent methyltransferase, partial [Longimicrobiaceae bacterium]|nr:SAM-dependent methyltransferase [Longimicrobiaceae bacterium]